MISFLDVIEKNKGLFQVTDNEIIQFFKFEQDVYETFKYILMKYNKSYKQNCIDFGKNLNAPNRVFIGIDKSGKCYLEVLGNDNRTVLIIQNDSCNFNDYTNITGAKIIESEFIKILDSCQKERVKNLGISKRFIKDQIPPIDICEEMGISRLINYYEYLNNDYFKDMQVFNEPENDGGHYQRSGMGSVQRKNNVIDYSDRKDELLRHHPFTQIKFLGAKTNAEMEAYVYDKNGFILAVVEPVSGLGYQYALNLGNIDKYDRNLIKDMIKAALEAKEEIVLLDNAIMRKAHTTFDVFKENLNIFLNSEKSHTKFQYDVEKSKEVYGKAR